MLIPSHVLLARRIIKNAKAAGRWSGFSSLAFYWGNVRPDFHSPFLRGTHVYELSIDKVEEKWRRAERNIIHGGIANSYRLGVVLHYVADYFTYAHNTDELDGGRTSHYDYEKRLHSKLAGADPEFGRAVSIGDLRCFLNKKREEYLAQEPSEELDCEFIYLVAWMLTQWALSAAAGRRVFA